MSQVQTFYDASPATEWQREARHRTEFAVTRRALVDFLPPPPVRVFDVGGGPGRYAIDLARRGYRVTLLDLARGNLDWARQRARTANVALDGVLHGDALHLPLPDAIFDAVLLMGPLYHLLDLNERERCVREAHRVLRPGGLIFAAFITRFCFLRDSAANDPAWVLDHWDYAQHLLETGQNVNQARTGFPSAYFAHVDEVGPLLEGAGFETLARLGVEGVVSGHEEAVNKLTGEDWAQWVELNYRVSSDPSLLGGADHVLYVGRSE